ncbi:MULTISPECIES: glutamate racemase [Streptomyces]|uniref:glutamate racemase n=1 Tax=Streptomyces TaxID=1883 RepID=UPI00068C1A93|nr:MULTISPECIES: glutamate racemase [Streptomyces]
MTRGSADGTRTAPAPRIGVFDSGIGGLTLLEDLRRAVPGCEVIYLADTANLPFGDKPEAEIADITSTALRFLHGQTVDVILIGCNTADACRTARPGPKGSPPDIPAGTPVVGVIEATARASLPLTRSGVIGLMATEATVGRRAYERAFARWNPRLDVRSVACPVLGPLIHTSARRPELEAAVDASLAPLCACKDLDTLVLGCTAYPVIQDLIQNRVGPGVRLATSGPAAARAVTDALGQQAAARSVRLPASYVSRSDRFLVTGSPAEFAASAHRFLGLTVVPEPVSLMNEYQRRRGS